MRILEHPQFNLDDFRRRFEMARASAGSDLRRVFDFSRKLGLSLSKYLGVTFELNDLKEILPKLGTVCFDGEWQAHGASYVLKRSGCRLLQEQGSSACDYWREALDGLVMGLCEDERFARHESCGHGDASCVDVLFLDRESVRLGPIGSAQWPKLRVIQECFQAVDMNLNFKGKLESTVYYELNSKTSNLKKSCSDSNADAHRELSEIFSAFFPTLKLQDVSPLAVIGGEP